MIVTMTMMVVVTSVRFLCRFAVVTSDYISCVMMLVDNGPNRLSARPRWHSSSSVLNAVTSAQVAAATTSQCGRPRDSTHAGPASATVHQRYTSGNIPLGYFHAVPDTTPKLKSYVIFLLVMRVARKRTGFGVSEVVLKRAGCVAWSHHSRCSRWHPFAFTQARSHVCQWLRRWYIEEYGLKC